MDYSEYYRVILDRDVWFPKEVQESGKEEFYRSQLEKMQKLRRMTDQAMEKSTDCLFWTDNEGKAIWINEAYERITGYDRRELLGKSNAELVKKGMINKSGAMMAIEQRKTVTIKQYYPSGKNAMVTSTPIFDEDGQIVFTVSNVRDLTEIEDMEEKLDVQMKKTRDFEKQVEQLRLTVQDNEIIAQDPKMVEVFMMAKRFASVDSNVLICGETGTGKEEVARYIQRYSPRSKMPFVTINCGAIPENLFESELFGYEKGAFTGASSSGKVGLIEAGNQGTVFLDEVGELPLAMQVKLLRVIQERKIRRVGGNRDIPVDIRIISATNRNLEKMVSEGTFRQDLFYRLNIIPITIPPLRNRPGDIVPMANKFLKEYNDRYEYGQSISTEAYRALMTYNWPGNVREMRNLIERAVVMVNGRGTPITSADLNLPQKQEIRADFEEGVPLREKLEKTEYEYMKKALEVCGSAKAAAESLGMSEPTFSRKKRKYESLYSEKTDSK